MIGEYKLMNEYRRKEIDHWKLMNQKIYQLLKKEIGNMIDNWDQTKIRVRSFYDRTTLQPVSLKRERMIENRPESDQYPVRFIQDPDCGSDTDEKSTKIRWKKCKVAFVPYRKTMKKRICIFTKEKKIQSKLGTSNED